MIQKKFVQIGRVAYVAFGPEQGKLVTIVDLIDSNRALVDGPNVTRQSMNIKSLHLTKFLLKFQHSARKASVLKAWNKFEVDKKWGATKWAQRVSAQQTRANLTDFERFKLMRAKQARNRMITLEAGKLRLKARKSSSGAATKKPAAAKKPAKK